MPDVTFGVGGQQATVVVNVATSDVPVVSGHHPNGFTVPEGETWEIGGLVTSSGNVVVLGTLKMRPGSTLRFVDVDETDYVGGGMTVADTPGDVGLWVHDRGTLDVQGTPKRPWARLAAPGVKGSSVLELAQDPTGWNVGDRLTVTPTLPQVHDDASWAYDTRSIVAIDGRAVTLDGPLDYDHPHLVPGRGLVLGAEVLNLTRDVVIGGTPGGRSHILVSHTMGPHRVDYARIEHVGPQPGGVPAMGRYGLHFHHNQDGTRGSSVRGTVVTQCGNHAFVPHESNGINFHGAVAHATRLAAFWWDHGDRSSDIVYDGCVASGQSAVWNAPGGHQGDRMAAFDLLAGNRNVIRNCVAVGTVGGHQSGGFVWQADFHGSWIFNSNLAHNSYRHGSFTWENSHRPDHLIERLVTIHCKEGGLHHGAYLNNYHYVDGVFHETEAAGPRNVVQGAGALHALSNDPAKASDVDDTETGIRFDQQQWHRCTFTGPNALAMKKHNAVGFPVRMFDCEFYGDIANDEAGGQPSHVEFIDCLVQGQVDDPGASTWSFAGQGSPLPPMDWPEPP